MSYVPNRHYNDPNIGQAFSNLTAAFAPPSGADLSGYATAKAKREEALRLAQLFDYAQAGEFDQTKFDRMGAASGQWTPSQGYYAVDQSNATARRGQDIDAQTSITNNQNTVRGSTIASLFGPLDQGQVRPALPESLAETIGLPAIAGAAGAGKPLSETEWLAAQNERMLNSGVLTDQALIDNIVGKETPVSTMGPDGRPALMSPGAAVRTGAAPVLNESEWTAAQNDRLLGSGELTDQMLVDAIVGKETPVQTLGADGNPIYMSPGAAVRKGANVYDKTAASTDADNYLAVGADGQELRFVGYVGADGKIRDRATGEIVPNVVRREGTGGGMSLEVGKDGQVTFSTGGGNTISRTTSLQSQINENDRGAQELIALYDNLRRDDVGLLGTFNENVMTDLGAQLNPDLARPDVVARRNQLRASTANLAKAIMNDDRLSDTDRRFARDIAVSDGVDVSLPGAQAQIAQLTVLLRWQEAAARAQLAGEPAPSRDRAFVGRLVDEGKLPAYVAKQYLETMNVPRSPRPGDAAEPVAPSSQPAAQSEASELPMVSTMEEAQALPSGTRFRAPDGSVRVVP